MRILIIGGTGLISTSITKELVEHGHDVTLYNRGKLLAKPPSTVRLLVGDRTDYAVFEQLMREAGEFDCVMDMVGYLPEDAHSVVRAFHGRVGQFIFCSTVDVYTKPARRYPYREDEPLGGLGDYAVNKVKCEHILMAAHDRGEIPLTIIRPAYTYGDGRGPVHSFGGSSSYLDRIHKGKPIVVHGDGNSLWTACHRDDVAHAFVVAAGKSTTLGKAYHVTGEEWLTWNQYHHIVAEAINAPAPQLIHIPSDVLNSVAPRHAGICAINFQFNNVFDNTAARTDLAFQYTISWLEGAGRMYRWLVEHDQIVNSDDDTFEDRLIASWQQLGSQMAASVSE